jgi:hypothetical protein
MVRPSGAAQPNGWQNGRKINILKENSLPSTRSQNIWQNKKKNQSMTAIFVFKICNYCYTRPLWLLEQGAKKDPRCATPYNASSYEYEENCIL